MPGKGDFGTDNATGKYAVGSKEWRAWDEGWNYRYTGDGVTNPKTNNPFDSTERPVEKQAWDDGYDSAAAATATTQRMPWNTGAASTP